MKRTGIIILPITILLAFSCTKDKNFPSPHPDRDLSMPEKVEKEFIEVLSKDWGALSDTLAYFNSTMLSKGKIKGKAPDGVFYELRISTDNTSNLRADFVVEDSVLVSLNGRTTPLEISLHAFETKIAIKQEDRDSTSLLFSKIRVVGPDRFFFEDKHKAVLYYEDRRVGFITWEEFENIDYSTGTYLVFHYYNDTRKFALYDKGFSGFLKLKLTDVLK